MEQTPVGRTGKAPGSAFTGDVYMTSITTPRAPSRLFASMVRFTPGSRTHWHSHAVGQTLYVTEGVGTIGTRDGVVLIRPGDTIWAEPGEEHWHGAAQGHLMCHIAMLEWNEDGSDPTTWLEPVSDDEYRAANAQ
jgi:quercetin dioxygenase-like cupin family protein